MRIGIGYDVHRLVEGRKLIMGGVEIPHKKGLLGHSDADVLVHAIMDAMLGAICYNDIGYIFPDTDPKYKDISSLVLLKKVSDIINTKGFYIVNIDSVIIADEPKFSPYRDEMRKKIADTLETSLGNISIKATTTEGLGFTGTGEGIAAKAVVLLGEKVVDQAWNSF